MIQKDFRDDATCRVQIKARHKIFKDGQESVENYPHFGISRLVSGSHTVSRLSLLIAAHTRSTFSGVLLVAGLPEHG